LHLADQRWALSLVQLEIEQLGLAHLPEDAPEFAGVDHHRDRGDLVPVDDARDVPFHAEAPGLGSPQGRTRLDLQANLVDA
jgi:hypothetical protein